LTGTHPTGAGHILLGAAGDPSFSGAGDQLVGIYRLSDPALAELPLPRLLDELLARIHEILGVDTVAILLLDTEAGELVARAAKGIEEEVKRGVRIPLGRGFAGRIAAERVPITIPDVDHADVLNPLLREAGIRSLLGVPLVVEDSVLGVLHVGTLTYRRFTTRDAALLQLAASRAAPAIERAQLVDALDREHRSAVALQRTLLPETLPAIAEVDVAARYLPARDEVGGDWYDVLDLPDDRVGVAIGDVAGHGVRAAALMGQMRTGLRAYALEGHGPAQILRLLDRLIQAVRGRGMATVAYAVLEPDTGAVTMASAGHPPALVVSESGEARFVGGGPSPPLGTFPFARYEDTAATLAPGEALMLYTDGLVETRGVPLADTLQALRAAAAGGPHAGADALCDRVLRTLLPSREGEDDVAIVALRREAFGDTLSLRLPAEPEALGGMRRTLARWLRAHGAAAEDVQALTLACGEAAANAVEHAYPPGPASFELDAALDDGAVAVVVRDYGRWRTPRGENRGRGLAIIEALMDEVEVRRGEDGSELRMRRRLDGR
jgi:serine phosphatase RsbU (regulator of sigma subunit)/anti-sigma regulatory factor (Ser/Thr protein kinase)